MAQVLGRVKIVVGTRTIRTKKGAKLDPGGITRTAVTATDGSVHYTEDIKEAVLDFVALHTPDLNPLDIHAMADVTANFIGDNGVTYVINHAFSSTPPEINDDGEAPFKFFGDPAIAQ